MEAEDKVTSEVNHFSKIENILHSNNDQGGNPKINTSEKNVVEESSTSKQNNSKENDKEDVPYYTCLLGANGQVVLWNPDSETVLSRFEFSNPDHMVINPSKVNLAPKVDEEGDLEVVCETNIGRKDEAILIEQNCYVSHSSEHQSATTLDLVGEQVWRGALFLADFILHNPLIFKTASILEVASGVGLSSIVAAIYAKKVITTDVNKGDIIDLITKNIQRNKNIIKGNISVEEIDFYDLRTIDDLAEQIDDVNILLAADVVYHNQLTDAFINAVLNLMRRKPNKTMFIALEKRYVFTIEDMDTVAPCYEYFVNKLEWLNEQETTEIEWNIEQLSSDFPQYFTYERTAHLVLWKIQAVAK